MPYTAKQHALFMDAAHDQKIAKNHGITMKAAQKMAKDGVKKEKLSDLMRLE